MLRKPAFWVAAVVVSTACAVGVVTMFPYAFPVVTLDVKMSRPEALAEARALAEQHGWGPEGRREATTFALDAMTRDFVELEGGGTDVFRELIAGDVFSPYAWRVRHFKEGDAHETSVWFWPSGKPSGFRERFAETEPGAELGKDDARSIAEAGARAWGVDLSRYELVEHEVDDNPPQRTDHALEYQLRGVRLGDEGEHRLRLRVAGDRFAGLEPYVKIPESFQRRYEKMRSANNAIASIASIGAFGLYLVVGGLVGLFVLLRARALLWRAAFAWGFFIAFLQVLASLNAWPLLWMDYDTALSSRTFLLQQVAQLAGVFIGFGLLLGASFMLAESLTRRAFAHHPQLWRLWSREVAPTPGVLGRTLGGYLLVPLALAYVLAFYFLAHRGLGWWSPSEALTDPDVLATRFPWLGPIAISAQAGFWEECLFRAVPIAGAALIGQRLGRRRLFIGLAVGLQAVVFAAAHANYPNQPSYARVVELIVPAVVFALIYLGFGLLTAVVLHYAYDAVLFALPLFTSSAEGAWVHQVLAVLFILVPLGVVVTQRARAGRWAELPEGALNAAWTPAVRRAPPAEAEPPSVRPPLSARTAGIAAALGVAAAIAWAMLAPWSTESPTLKLGRAQAIERARAELAERGVDTDPPWKLLSSTVSGLDDAHRFAWRELGRDTFRGLLGQHLSTPRWDVRVARFVGDVAERAEEWRVRVAGDGGSTSVVHRLPEARAGASLSEEQAREIAYRMAREHYGLEPSELEEIEISPSKRPARVDWTVTFGNRREPRLEQGDRRLSVQIAGDEVTDLYRWLHVPEQWERDERERTGVLLVPQVVGGLGVALLVIAGAVAGVVSWARGRFAVRPFLFLAGAVAVLNLLGLVLGWPQQSAGFSSAQAWTLQAGLVVGVRVVGAVLLGGVLGLIGGLVHSSSVAHGEPVGVVSWLRVAAGLGLGVVAAALAVAADGVLPSLQPTWGSTQAAGHAIPLLSELTAPLIGLIALTLFLLAFMDGVDRMTTGWTRRRVVVGVVFAASGLVASGATGPDSLLGWAVGGVVAGALGFLAYAVVFRFDLSLVPLTVAGMVGLGRIVDAVQAAHPAARPGALISVALLLGAALLWHRALSRRGAATPLEPRLASFSISSREAR